jgi:exonuclease SbcC
MIPISLTLKGIYSYRETQTIDFTKLTEGQIFGIFGAVGSGKSTILEAISFALYNDTERLNKAGDDRYYNMMNLKSNELEIDFIFRMKEGEEYRVLVLGKRGKKDFKTVKKFERTAYFKVKDNWEPTDKKAEEIIGLSYENFRRTVIIPQGQFEEFLKLGKTDRTRMMKDIFVLGKYDLSGKVKSLENANKEKLDILTGSLQQFVEVTEEAFKEAKADLKVKEKELTATTKQVKLLQKSFQQTEELKEVFSQAAVAEDLFKKIGERKGEFENLGIKIKQTEDCLIRFKPLLDRKKDIQNRGETSQKDAENKETQFSKVNTDIENKETHFKEIKEKQTQKEQESAKVKDLQNLLEIKTLSVNIEKSQKRIGDGQKLLDEVEKELKAKKAESEKVKLEVKKAEENRPDGKELSELQLWFSQRKNLELATVETRKELADAEEQFKLIGNKFRGTLAKSNCTIAAKNMNGAVAELETLKTKKEQEFQKVEEEKTHWQLKNKLEEFAAKLEDGAPCPICGSTEHPAIINSDEAKAEIGKIERKLGLLKSELENLTLCIGEARIIIAQAGERNKIVEAKKVELKEKETKQKAHDATFAGKNYRIEEEEKVALAVKELEQAEEALQKMRVLTEKLYQEEEALEKKEKQYKEGITKIKNALAKDEGTKEALSSQLSVLKIADFVEHSEMDLRQKANVIQKNILETEKQFNTLQAEIETLKQQKNSLAGQLSEVKKQQESLDKELAKLTKEIEAAIKTSDYSNEVAILEILNANLNLETAKVNLEKFNEEYQKGKLNHESLQARIKGQKFDEQLFLEQKEQYLQSEILLNEQSEMVGKQKQVSADLEKKLKEKKVLSKDLNALKKRGENIAILKSLFRQEGFVSYISSVYLQNLCEAANHRFYQLTKQQLRLELNADNGFDVRDYLNDGKLRNVKTLSGGQTFQASLSLALALAESVQKQNQTDQNFFFLDEGFGTQDEDSLQAIFEALKGLRKENRIVGVISHVKGLQQEIDVSLLIEKDEETGSIVRPSWQ